MIKIYLISVMVYAISVWLAFEGLSRWLDQEYRESEDFKERIDTFAEVRQDWFKDIKDEGIMRLVLVGICPIVHWLGIIVCLALAVVPDKVDWLIRKAIDKIFN